MDVFILGGILLKLICTLSPRNVDEEDKGDEEGAITMLMEAMKPSTMKQ